MYQEPVIMEKLYLYFRNVLEKVEKCNKKKSKFPKIKSRKVSQKFQFFTPLQTLSATRKKLRVGIKNPPR